MCQWLKLSAVWLVLFFGLCAAQSVCAASDNYIGSFGRFDSIIGDVWEQTSPYGYRDHPILEEVRFHDGIDIGADSGTVLRALGNGIVTEQSIDYGGYGLFVTVHYPWAAAPNGSDAGIDVLYAHLRAVGVGVGDTVRAGQTVGFVGGDVDDPYAGRSTGPHVHLGVYYAGTNTTIDPALYFSDLVVGGNGTGGGNMHRAPAVTIEFRADMVKPIREVVETIVTAATMGLHLIADGVQRVFAVLITIDLALGLLFFNVEQKNTGFLAYLAYKFLFYGFLLFLLTHWGDFVGNFSRDLFSEAAAVMSSRTQEEIAAAISTPTDVMEKGLSIVFPIFSQCVNDSAETLFLGLGLVLLLGFLILVCFCIIAWHVALAYIEFYLMVLFSFTTFMFAGEKHLRIHAENGVNGIIASAVHLMFFNFFAVTLQGVMADLTVDSVMASSAGFFFHINILLKLFLVVLMFMFVGDRIGGAILNSFGSRGFTFRTNS